MKDLWRRIEAWGKKSGAGSLKLRDGATKKALDAAESSMRLKLPSDLRESLLLHDGQEDSPDFEWLPGCAPMHGIAAIAERWKKERKLEAAKKGANYEVGKYLTDRRYDPTRIPIAWSDDYDQHDIWVDLGPGAKGTVGQLVADHKRDFVLDVVRPSLREALDHYATLLESGKLEWSAKYACVVPKGKRGWKGHPVADFAKMKA